MDEELMETNPVTFELMETSNPEDSGADAFEENGTHVDFENLSLRF
jgi:hypothetical protein